MFTHEISEKIKNGGVGVIPTDTLYGIVCSAMSAESVERIYSLKNRNPEKPLIVLIGQLSDLNKFGISSDEQMALSLKKYWPGPNSIILPVSGSNFNYLTRGSGGIAFRFPADEELAKFLRESGSIVAPSANLEGEIPASTIESAELYFPELDFYVNGGEKSGEPSKLLKFADGKFEQLR